MISDLDKIEFHDLPVNAIRLDFDHEELAIHVSEHDEILNDYVNIEVVFIKVRDLFIEKMDTLYIEEIYSSSLLKRDTSFFIEFTMLYGNPRISVNMSFCFEDVTVKYHK